MANKTEKYVIEHGVSVPRASTKYPWRQMKVGDSFVASYEEVDRIRAAAAYFATRNPEFAFTTRKVDAGLVCACMRENETPRGGYSDHRASL